MRFTATWMGITCKRRWSVLDASFGLSVMFNGSVSSLYVLDFVLTKNPTINEAIANLLHAATPNIDAIIIVLKSGCDCLGLEAVNKYLEKIINQVQQDNNWSSSNNTLKLGVEYDDNFLNCFQPNTRIASIFSSLDYAILKLEISPATTMLSYSFFTRYINALVTQNRETIEKANPTGNFFVRLVYTNWREVIGETSFPRFKALTEKHFQAWQKETNFYESFVIPPLSRDVNVPGNIEYLKQKAISFLPEVAIRNSSISLFRNYCESMEAVTFLHSVFNSIIVDYSSSKYFLGKQNLCPNFDLSSHSHLTSLPSGVFLNADEGQLQEWINGLPPDFDITRNFNTVYIYSDFFNTGRRETELNLIKTTGQLKSRNFQIGCVVSFLKPFSYHQINHHIFRKCGPLFASINSVINAFIFDIDPTNLLTQLEHIRKVKAQFEVLYPKINWIPMFQVYRRQKDGEIVSCYCNFKETVLNVYQQTFHSFASIHNWTLAVGPFGEIDFKETRLWYRIPVNREINTSVISRGTNQFFRTNSEKVFEQELPMTYPCVKRLEMADQGGIMFLSNPYSGATFDLSLREKSPLTVMELQIALLFVLEKFQSFELIASDPDHLERIGGDLFTTFSVVVKLSRPLLEPDKPIAYIETAVEALKSLKQEKLRVPYSSHCAVHMKDWESLDLNSLSQLLPFGDDDTLSYKYFGITVQNCSHEINTGLARLKNIPFFHYVTYVICNEKATVPYYHNENWMFEYLSTMLFKKRYMERNLALDNDGLKVKQVEVMFRINLISTARECQQPNDIDVFLRLLNEFDQYSLAYKIKFFVVRAFSSEGSTEKCPYTWWNIRNHSDLANESVYVDREKEFFGQTTKLATRLPPQKVSSESFAYTHVSIFVACIVAVCTATVLLWVYRQRSKKTFLSKFEVEQFYKGVILEEKAMSLARAEILNVMQINFPDCHEIAEQDIELQGLIGSGQFGVVYKGLLSKMLEVAIKKHDEDCDKEHFINTLKELKILCYLGDHPNLIKLHGAYTKEIGAGKLFIVTELCANGSLRGYLRQSCIETPGMVSTIKIGLYQLSSFACDIASGMEYVAEKRVVHGDLAARNVLVTSELKCKIADFGLSRQLHNLNEYKKSGQEPLPWKWLAPECLSDMVFSTKSDVWSYGVTLWEIFSFGQLPYPGLSWTEDFVKELETGFRMGKPGYGDETIYSIILECWSYNPNERPIFTELKEFFTELRKSDYETICKS